MPTTSRATQIPVMVRTLFWYSSSASAGVEGVRGQAGGRPTEAGVQTLPYLSYLGLPFISSLPSQFPPSCYPELHLPMNLVTSDYP